jgi:hypothetical protein
MPSSVSMGLRAISAGNSLPSEESVALPGMLFSKPLRDQDFEALANQFIAGVAEQFLRLGVYKHNQPLRIHSDHRVGGGIEEIAERPFHRGFIIARLPFQYMDVEPMS